MSKKLRLRVNSFMMRFGGSERVYYVEQRHTFLGFAWWTELSDGPREHTAEAAMREARRILGPAPAPMEFKL